MAEDFNPVRNYGSGGDQPSAGSSGTPANRNLQSAANSFNDVGKQASENMDALMQRLDKVNRMGKDLDKIFQGSATSLKHMIDYADDMEESLKSWQTLSKKLANQPGIFSSRDRKESIKFLEDFLTVSKRMWTDRHFLNPAQQKQVASALSKTKDMVEDLKNTSDDAFDSRKVDNLTRAFVKTQAAIQKIDAQIGKLPIGRLTKGFQDINKAIAGTPFEKFSGVGKFLDKIHAAKELRGDIQQARKARDSGGRGEFARRAMAVRAKAYAQGIALERAGEKYKFPTGRGGERIRGTREGFRNLADTMTRGPEGERGNWVDRRIAAYTMRKVADAQGTGEDMGRVPSYLLRKMQEGGGRATTGMIGESFGLSDLAGKAAVPIAILQMVQAAYDKNALMNRAVEQGVGQGGLFTGMKPGERAEERLTTFRNAINVQPMNTLGMTYEKNLKMMQDIVQSGLTVGAVARGEARPATGERRGQVARGGIFGGGDFADTTGAERANDFFTTVSRNMYIGGTKLGIDPTAAVNMTVKLLTTYRQSFQQSEGFFQRLDKESTAAGISAGKYVEIIDSIESQFSSLNRNLRDTTDTLAVLGSTGMNTSEDLKDAFDLLTNKNQTRGLGQQAFVNRQLYQSGALEESFQGRKENTQNLADQLSNELKGQGIAVSAPDLIKMQGNFAGLMTRVQNQPMGENDRQNIGSLVKELRQAMVQQGVTGLGARGKYLEMASAQGVVGQDAAEQMQASIESVRFAMREIGGTLGDLGNVSGLVAAAGSKVAPGVMDTLQTNKELISRLPDIMQQMATTFTKQVQTNQLTDVGYIARQAKAIGPKIGLGLTGKETEQEAAEKMKEFIDASEINREKVSEALSTNERFFMGAIGPGSPMKKSFESMLNAPAEVARNKQIAQDATTAARPTAEVFTDAFTYLFGLLASPLNKLVELVTTIINANNWFQKSPVEVGQEFSAMYTPEKIAATQKEYADDISSMETSLKDMKDGSPEYLAAQTRLSSMKQRQALFSNFAGGQAPATDMGLSTAQDLLNPRGSFGLSNMAVAAATRQGMGGDQQARMIAKMLVTGGATEVAGAGAKGQLQLSATDYHRYADQIKQLEATGQITATRGEGNNPTVVTFNNYNTDQVHNFWAGGVNKAPGEKAFTIPKFFPKTPTSQSQPVAAY